MTKHSRNVDCVYVRNMYAYMDEYDIWFELFAMRNTEACRHTYIDVYIRVKGFWGHYRDFEKRARWIVVLYETI